MSSVSVVIAAYNAAGFIGRAVESALRQSAPPREIIIVDDASTDETAAVLTKLAALNRCVKIVSRSRNGGPAAARNAGFAVAQGDWLAVLDADDAFAPERLARLVAFAEATGADVAADGLAFYDAMAGRVTGDTRPQPGPADLEKYLAHNLADGKGVDWGLLKPVFRRQSLAARALRYREDMTHGEDFQLMVDLLASGAVFQVMPEPLYIYTQRYGAVSGEPSGQTRTAIAYARLADAAALLASDPKVAGDARLVKLLRQRELGLRRLHASHVISTSIRERDIRQLTDAARRQPGLMWQTLGNKSTSFMKKCGIKLFRQFAGAGRYRSKPPIP